MEVCIMKDYSIGIDIGTGSVGWAVINPTTYKIMRKGNKSLWGVRLFDSAISAADRRKFRSSRRRYERRRQRLNLLRNEFEYEINKVDPNFFKKLKESFYKEEDILNKTIKISSQEQKAVVEYNRRFPTIYHLRNHLILSDEKMDIRLVYLAIHHIIKYRGNFLYDNDNFNVNDLNIQSKLKEIFESINLLCHELEFKEEDIDNIDYAKLEEFLTNNSKNDKKQLTKEYLSNFLPKSVANEFSTKLIVGNQFSLSKLFNMEILEDVKISFSGTDYEDNFATIENCLGDRIETLNLMKQLYDILFLKGLFKNSKSATLSGLMVEKYKQHNNDLRYLKAIFSYNRRLYNILFRNEMNELCLYEKYTNNKFTYDEFITNLNKLLGELWISVNNRELIDKYTVDIEMRIKNGDFLPRLTDKDNGKYPFQLNKKELELIIENQGKYYPFLKEKVNDKYKLIKLLEFRIPYYVGPLVSDKHSKFAWMERKQSGVKITPYNFDDVIDKKASAEKFITRMIGHCTYLLDEPAMPSNSILYSEFKVLNELKQIKINGDKLTTELQHKIIDDFFKKVKGTLTEKKFKEYLNSLKEFDMYDGNLTITGYSADKQFANNMQSYIDFFGDNGFFKDKNLTIQDAENIIRWITIFEDKDILEEKIREEYPILSDIVSKIILKRYKGWSSLSLKLLTEIYYTDKSTNLKKNIMDLMYETEENFMQIINNDEYDFQSLIAICNKEVQDYTKINYDLVKELATSPAVKRGIFQSLLVIQELVKYMGYEPKNISIEMARGDDKVKKRTMDRKKYLLSIYDANKNTINDYKNISNKLKSLEKVDSQKLFLYFIQEGKSLYSGESLEIEKLNEYEVDHIIPRTIYKDDSIDNKALVLKEENQEKGANLVLPSRFRKNKIWWEHLKSIGLISPKKFYNLCRKEYSQEDINGFINRQIVETRQITKHVANILKNFYKDTNIIYLPASLSHNYREKNGLYKFRNLNDYHHAHDAYLAAVLGEYKKRYFTGNIDFERLRDLNRYLIANKKYNELGYGYVVNSIDPIFVDFNKETGEVIFDAEYFIKTVEDTLYRNDILISKKTEIKTGEFYNQTIYGTNSNKARINLKKNLDYKLYGGYTSYNYSYMMLVNYKTGKEIEKALIGIPVLLINQPCRNKCIDNYIKESLSCSEYKVLKTKIPFNILIQYKGQLCSLTGCAVKSAEVINAVQFKLKKDEQIKYKDLLNFIFNKNYPDKNKFIKDEKMREELINRDDYKIYCENIFDKQIDDLFKLILDKIKTDYPLYDSIYLKLYKIYEDGTFFNLMLINKNVNNKDISKVQVILELFKMLGFNSSNANLEKIKGSVKFNDRIGRNNGVNIKSGILIYKSVTGLKENKYEF